MIVASAFRGPDFIIVIVSAVFSGIAFGVNVVAGCVAPAWFRVAHFAAAGLAAVYCGAYVLLAGTDVDPGEWSSIMRGVALWAWWIVWILPALLRIQYQTHVRSTVADKLVAEVEKQLVS